MKTTFDEAIDAARAFFGSPTITRGSVRKQSKGRHIVEVGQFIAAYMRAKNPNIWSYPRIAGVLNRADHATIRTRVINAHQKWGKKMFQRMVLEAGTIKADKQEIPQAFHVRVTYAELIRDGEKRLAEWRNGARQEDAA